MDLPNEVWKPVPGFESDYEVSSLGRVRRTSAACHTHAGRVLRPSVGPRGAHVRLTRMATVDGQRVQVSKQWLVHRLVYCAFVRPLGREYRVVPMNGDYADPRLVNLAARRSAPARRNGLRVDVLEVVRAA